MDDRRSAICVVMVLALLLVGAPARAQAPAAAQALFESGRAAFVAGDVDTACARFRESDRLYPQTATKANLGSCEAARGRLATAWDVLRAALEKMPDGDPGIPVIREAMAAIEPRLPRLTLTQAPSAPAGMTVSEGGIVFGNEGTWGVSLPFNPGAHRLTVAVPGRAPRVVDVVLVEGKTATLVIGELVQVPPAPAPVKAPPAPENASPGPWIVGSVGVAALIVGGVTGAIVLQKKSTTGAHCTDGPPPTCRDQAGLDAASAVRTFGPVSTVGLVVGAAGIAGGAIWLGVRSKGKQSARIGVVPMVAGAGWSLEGSW